jgi:hypothetical protein
MSSSVSHKLTVNEDSSCFSKSSEVDEKVSVERELYYEQCLTLWPH